MPIPYVIDFNGLTMNTTVANDKLVGNVMEEVKNNEMLRIGNFAKRYGIQDQTSGTDITATAINAIAPYEIVNSGSGTQEVIVIADDEMWRVASQTGNWIQVVASLGGVYNSYPYQISWGITGNYPAVYFTPDGDQPIRYDTTNGDTIIGTGSFTTCTCTEYYLDKLWAGATSPPDKLQWTVTGDDDDWTGVGSGFIKLNIPGANTLSQYVKITGLRVYKNRLYVGTRASLHVITGTTSATFGQRRIREQNWLNGATMYAVGDYLFYTDRDGIWQFNGTQAVNLVKKDMIGRWDEIGNTTDVDDATATWDSSNLTYSVWFRNKGEMWTYHIATQQWQITDFNSTDAVRVISPPMPWDSAFIARSYLIGTATNGKVYRYPSATIGDDGNAITASFKTGHIRLGEINGQIGNQFRIEGIDIETVQQDEAGVVKIQMTIDGTAGTQETLTVGDAGASADTFPTIYNGRDGNTQIDLTDLGLTGHTFQMEVSDDDANSRCDIRRMVIWYESLGGKSDA